MPTPDAFFAEFPSVSKADWLARIAKELKDKTLDDLAWQPEPGLRVEPFAHADDFSALPRPLTTEPQGWEICEHVPADDPAAANAQALEALGFGAEGLDFEFSKMPASGDFEVVFEKIQPDFIGLHFSGAGVAENPGLVLALLQALAQSRGLDAGQLRGSLSYDPAARPGLHDWRYLADLQAFAGESFSGFKIISIRETDTEGVVEGLFELLKKGNLYLEKLSERGVAAAQTAAAMQFSMRVGRRYFLEIARLRAFKLLWMNVLRGWKAPVRLPEIEVSFRPDAYGDDLYTNMIRATTMATSAALGGARRLTVLPYDAGREAQARYGSSFARRIARNVQHILKMESGLDALADPAAGSFYIEKLTRQLAEQAWERFSEKG